MRTARFGGDDLYSSQIVVGIAVVVANSVWKSNMPMHMCVDVYS